ncbi:hypothetical protein HK57_00426 [Aspergillus ustus]|uniref:Uncharacterized protein n=1 Tax=Aspergillus ustus TaxID=40382 RepID=A0A0C1E2N8_ASPUT|nr:hypothetical protein HK57_00426 [Aspergillus ustus]
MQLTHIREYTPLLSFQGRARTGSGTESEYTIFSSRQPPPLMMVFQTDGDRSLCRDRQHDTTEPVAIVGMAMRLPGGVRTEEAFWDLLVNKKNGLCAVPTSRCSKEAMRPLGEVDSGARDQGFFLQEDPAYFDPSLFSISAQDAGALDPQQRLLLQVVWECMESAGQKNWRGTRTGCYVGVFGEDWVEMAHKDVQHLSSLYPIATGDFALANQVSYQFDLRGPSMTIRTACSSSLVGLHEACQALQSGSCNSALVCGTSLLLTPTMSDAMATNMVLSPSGMSHTFDAQADGYGRGEAINCIYIKPLRDAIHDNDPIRAIIRATGTNHNGHSPILTHPSAAGQESLIRWTYQRAGIDDISETPLFECHGTGTRAGDVVEASVIAKLTDGTDTYITSVKPNVGHSEGASGITSIIKATLSLEHRTIPPNINFKTPHPDIPFEQASLNVPLDATAWPPGRPERISVNSFGIGGSNAHAIIESASSLAANMNLRRPLLSSTETCEEPQLLIVTAHSQRALEERVRQTTLYIRKYPARLQELAFTLSARREHLSHRAVAVVHPGIELAPDTESFFTKFHASSPSPVFVFTGQGAQWPGMGRTLLSVYPEFLKDVQFMDTVLQALPDGPSWRLHDELARETPTAQTHQAAIAQPLCVAIQIGLFNMVTRLNIRPCSVVGHSSGEIAAAYAAGAISMETAIILAWYRGKLAMSQQGLGAMVAVGLSRDDVMPHLNSGVVVACHNSPQSITLSGDMEAVARAVESIMEADSDTFCKKLPVQVAYHSDHMKNIGSEYESCIANYTELDGQRDMIPFSSTVTGSIITDPRQLNASYWRRNLESPVLFVEAVQNLPMKGSPVFIELGPHSALAAPLRQISPTLAAKSTVYIPTLLRYEEDVQSQLLRTAGHAYACGLPVNLAEIIKSSSPSTTRPLTDLPPYPWQCDRHVHWSESRLSREWRQRKIRHHELLGSRVLETTDHQPSWRNLLRLDAVPWLWDHVIQGVVTFPGAAFVAMAGEAILQLQVDAKGYAIRKTRFVSPLMLREDQGVEIVTSLRPIEVAEGVASGWHRFTIMSHDGEEHWTMHCQGQVKPQGDKKNIKNDNNKTSIPGTVPPFARAVPAQSWYQHARRGGLEFGPRFQQLRHITADPTGPRASATVAARDCSAEEWCRYPVHPTAIDTCLQLMALAEARGVLRRLSTFYVPASIDFMNVSEEEEAQSDQPMTAVAQTRCGARDGLVGNATAQLHDRVVISIDGAYLFPLDSIHGRGGSGGIEANSSDSVCHFEWRPDIDLLPLATLLPSPEYNAEHARTSKDLGQLCFFHILETAHQVHDIEPGSPHLAQWRGFLLDTVSSLKRGAIEHLYPGSSQWPLLESANLQTMLQNGRAQYRNDPESTPFQNIMRIVLENCKALMSGEVSPIELLLQDNVLHRFHEHHTSFANWSQFLSVLCHSNPGLRILEIGGGTGSATTKALESLKSANNTRLYARYVFTDISAGFLTVAAEKFAQEHMEYMVLDISSDPTQQGFDARSFDLIIASNVLHATPNLQSTLTNVLHLLSPAGHLLLHELSSELPVADFPMGVFAGWWLGASDGRVDKPYISPERWDSELRSAGFTGVEATAFDRQPPFHMAATMISRPLAQVATQDTEVLLLMPPQGEQTHCGSWTTHAQSALNRRGYSTRWTTLFDQPPSKGQFVVSLLELGDDGPVGHWPQEPYLALQRYLEQAGDEGCRILWVTQSTSHACADPRFSFIHGLARTLRLELMLDISVLEIPDWGDMVTGPHALVQVCEKLQRTRGGPARRFCARDAAGDDREYEFALSDDGRVQVGRYYWTSLQQQLLTGGRPRPPGAVLRKLSLTTYGLLDTLHWTEGPVREHLGGEEVEVEMQYVGLNFKDMMVAMGFMGDKRALGFEGSGIVRRLGSEVTDLTVGDRVTLISSGLFTTRAVVRRELCVKLPGELAMDEAATMLVVYLTAIYALLDVGGLREGQSVLIHSACGGVGLASIQVCQVIGAEIYATVGNNDKVQYLTEQFNIPRERIFNSRDASFRTELLRATGGRGVDVVLNSLTGNLLHASWECVAKFGRLVELGKRDFLSHGTLDMRPFLENRAFFGVDLQPLFKADPSIMTRTVSKLMQWYHRGKIAPIKPVKIFGATDIISAFRYLQAGTHMGKVLVDMTKCTNRLDCPPLKRSPSPSSSSSSRFRPDAAYLLVGGLGGVGQCVATWMVEQNARELIFFSRSAGESDADKAFIRELEVQGCQVKCVIGSVTDSEHVKEAVDSCTRPLAGVLHMALGLKVSDLSGWVFPFIEEQKQWLNQTLQDQLFLQMTHEDWKAGLSVKVDGAWNLHHATAHTPLDFFVVFGSVAGVCGNTGQSNYAAATTFLEAFTRYRRQQRGLPSSVLHLGAVGDVGAASRDPKIIAKLKGIGLHTMDERELVDAVAAAIKLSPADAPSASGALTVGLEMTKHFSELPANQYFWGRDARFSIYHNVAAANNADVRSAAHVTSRSSRDDVGRALIARIQEDPSSVQTAEFEQELVTQIGRLINRSVRGHTEEDENKGADGLEDLAGVTLDSLVSIELRNWLRRSLGIDLAMVEINRARTVGVLAKVLRKKLAEKYGQEVSD